MSKQSEFAKEFLSEADKRGTTKGMSAAVGMPDAEDERLLQELISIYEKKTDGLLGYTLREARREYEAGRHGSLHNNVAKVNAQSNMTYDFELPVSFMKVVEKHWPTMFTDREHFRWFKRKLPQLMIRPKY